MPYDAEKMPSYFSGIIRDVPDAEFEALLKQPIPDGKWSGELGMNDAICQMYYAKSRLARMIYKILTNLKKKSEDKGKPDLNILFIYNMPFRGIAKMTHGAVSMKMAEGMAEVVNGHFMKGMKKVLGGFFENRKANKEYEKSWEPENKELANKQRRKPNQDFLLLCLRFYRNQHLQGKPVVFCVKCHRAAIFAGCLLNAFQSVSVITCVLLCCSRKLIRF